MRTQLKPTTTRHAHRLPALALDGNLFVHDPSSIAVCDGNYYIFGTGNGMPILTSSNCFTWQRAGKVFDRIPDDVHTACPLNNGRLSGALADPTPAELGKYLAQGQQKWTVAAAGGGYYKITSAVTKKVLEIPAVKPGEKAALSAPQRMAADTGADNQLWKIDQLTDGRYRVESKVNKLALSVVTDGPQANTAVAKEYKADDTQRWAISPP